MNKALLFLCLILLLVACNNDKQNTTDQMPPLFPAPISVPLNTAEGYSVNQFTGDSIHPLINSIGDTIITGRPFPVKGKVIDPTTLAKPRTVKAGTPKVVPTNTNVYSIRNQLTVIPIDIDSLKTFTPGESTASFVLINSTGDTIPTGVPIPIQGKVVPCLQPKPIKALPPRFKDEANYNIQYLDVGQGLVFSFVYGMLQDRKGNIWIGTELGLSRYDGEYFTNYSKTNGLVGSNVSRHMLEDSKGNIWFSCSSGISKYNGESFTHYTRNEGMPGNGFGPILEDSRGNFWYGAYGVVSKLTLNGEDGYDGKNLSGGKESITHYTTKEGLPNHFISSIIEDKQGNIWIGTNGGLYKLEGSRIEASDGRVETPSQVSFTHYIDKEGFLNTQILSLFKDKLGNIWIGTKYDGLFKLNFESLSAGKASLTRYMKKEDQFLKEIWSIIEDKQGNIWYSSISAGAHMIRRSGIEGVDLGNLSSGQDGHTQYTEKEGLSSDNVNSIIEDRSGNIWFGTYGRGINKYNPKSFTSYTEKEGLSHKAVWSILEDKNGNLWFGTFGGGVNKLVLSGGGYNGISLHTRQAGFYHYTQKEGLSDPFTRSILEDKSGNIWVGTKDSGVNKYDGKSFTSYTKKEGLSSASITSMLEDKNGNIWFTTRYDGVFKYGTAEDGTRGSQAGFTHYTKKEGLVSNDVWSMLEDKNGNLWFATYHGACKYDPSEDGTGGSFTHYTEKEGLSSQELRAILEDKNGNIWFGTYGRGVCKYGPIEDGTGGSQAGFTYYTEKEGLSDNFVNNLLEDNNGNIWVGTESGLNCLRIDTSRNKRDEYQEKIKNTSRIPIFNYTTEDGLKGLDFYAAQSAIIDRNNQAWWGTSNGLNSLDMNTFTFPDQAPSVQLDHVEINEQFIDFRNLTDTIEPKIKYDGVVPFYNYPLDLELPYNQNHLTFYFSALEWSAPHQIRYSYKMEGLNDTWSTPDKETKVDYRNLSYGTYTFKIRAIGASLQWSDAFEYTFTISPPWWHSWWARGLYLLLGLGVIFGYNRWRTNSLKKQKVALEQTVKERTEEVVEQKERAERSEKYKEQFLANMSHEIRTPMHAISGMTNILARNEHLQHQKKFLKAIRQSSGNLLVILNDILDLSKIEAGKIDVESIPMSPSIVIENVVAILKVKAEEKGLALQSSVSKEIPAYVYGDPTRLSQILLNLIGNAIKFTEKGKVNLSLTKVDDKLRFAIQDSGIGIPADKLEQVFGSFEQVNESTTRKYGGTGLGLSITKQLVDLQNGRIWVESQENVGSAFFFELPFLLVEADAVMETQLTEEQLKKMAVSLKGIKILLAEDNAFNVMVASDDLAYYIEEVTIGFAENGKIAIQEFEAGNYDLILMDIQMPELSGLDAAKAIRKIEAFTGMEKPIPIIAMTASLLKSEIDQCFEAGMDNYIPKPYKIEELIGTIHKEFIED